MTQARRYSDEELSAWVDLEGPPAERAAIEAWLRSHPDEAARVRAWAADREALHASFAPVAREAVPARLAEVVWRGGEPAGVTSAGARSRQAAAGAGWIFGAGRPVWGLAAAAAMLFVLGGLAGGWVTWQWKERQAGTQAARGTPGASSSPGSTIGSAAGPAAEGWLQRAAFAHSVYTIEPRHAVEVKAQEEHLARWLTRRIEAPVKLFDLRAQGYELVGGRLLPDGPGKGAQLMYQDGAGKRVTVYLRKPEPGTDTAFRYEQQGALGMFYWVDEKTGFALVGELPKERLLALAKAIYDQDAVLPAPSLTPPGAASAASPPSGASAAAGK